MKKWGQHQVWLASTLSYLFNYSYGKDEFSSSFERLKGFTLTKFGWGNTKSLTTQQPAILRDCVIDFYKEYYKSKSAKLAVIGEDIGELEQLVRGRRQPLCDQTGPPLNY